jgi:hypothetical protein
MKPKKFTSNRSITFVLSLATFLLLFSSCKKSNDAGAPANTISATLTAPTSTTTFQSASTFGFYYGVSKSYWLEAAQVVGGDSLLFDINFYDTVVVNKPYLITDAASGYVNVTFIKWKSHSIYAPDYVSPVGTLTVTSMNQTNHTVAGTFSGKFFATSTDSLMISNGKFNITCLTQ